MTRRIYGIHAARSFLAAPQAQPHKVILKSGNLGPRLREIEAQVRLLDCEIEYLPRESLDAIASNHQGVVVYAAEVSTGFSLETLIEAQTGTRTPSRLVLGLDGVTDPRNLGACMRSAATMGVDAIIAPQNNSAPLSSAAIKTACGGADLIPYLQVPNLARSLEKLKGAGFWIAGTVVADAAPIQTIDLTGDLVVVMGAEGAGLRSKTRECCDYLVTIPTVVCALGFNVSVAAGIVLYEIHRQRGLAS